MGGRARSRDRSPGEAAQREAGRKGRRGQTSSRQGRGRGISGRQAGDPAPHALQDRRDPGRGGSPPARVSHRSKRPSWPSRRLATSRKKCGRPRMRRCCGSARASRFAATFWISWVGKRGKGELNEKSVSMLAALLASPVPDIDLSTRELIDSVFDKSKKGELLVTELADQLGVRGRGRQRSALVKLSKTQMFANHFGVRRRSSGPWCGWIASRRWGS